MKSAEEPKADLKLIRKSTKEDNECNTMFIVKWPQGKDKASIGIYFFKNKLPIFDDMEPDDTISINAKWLVDVVDNFDKDEAYSFLMDQPARKEVADFLKKAKNWEVS